MTRTLTVIVVLATLAGCESRDPYERSDVWQPTGANAGNIAAMVANPRDMIMGRHSARTDASASTLAIEHVWSDHPKPLSPGQSGAPTSATPAGQGGT